VVSFSIVIDDINNFCLIIIKLFDLDKAFASFSFVLRLWVFKHKSFSSLLEYLFKLFEYLFFSFALDLGQDDKVFGLNIFYFFFEDFVPLFEWLIQCRGIKNHKLDSEISPVFIDRVLLFHYRNNLLKMFSFSPKLSVQATPGPFLYKPFGTKKSVPVS
jgi:hypothetical protein